MIKATAEEKWNLNKEIPKEIQASRTSKEQKHNQEWREYYQSEAVKAQTALYK